MGRFKALEKISINVKTNDENIVDEFCDYLKEEFGLEFEPEDLGDNQFLVTASEIVSGWYDPPVMYDRNGEGNPALYEIDDDIDEYTLEEICREFADRYDDENTFYLGLVKCEVEDYD